MQASKLYKFIGVICCCGLTCAAFAESAAQRRFNEARALDLKLRQQQILRQQPDFSMQQELEKRFERQRFEQWELQQRQLRQTTPSDSPSRREAQNRRFEREQRGQELDFKTEQQIPPANPPEPVFEFERQQPAWREPGFNDR